MKNVKIILYYENKMIFQTDLIYDDEQIIHDNELLKYVLLNNPLFILLL